MQTKQQNPNPAKAQTQSQGQGRPPQVKDLMTRNPVFISSNATVQDAARKMENVDCGILPVGTPEKIEGVITDRDIVIRVIALGKDANTEKVRDYMTPGVVSCREDDTVDRAADMMRENNVNRLIVKNQTGKPSGILSFGRLLREEVNMSEIASVIERAVGPKAA
ncbi:MAG: CBS domain-containing protein [Alphaproteobacteria bacterium]